MGAYVEVSKILRESDGGLYFKCPACRFVHGVRVTAPKTELWQWNGNVEKPTFSPSLLMQRETWTPPVTPENLAEWRRQPWEQVKVPSVCHSFITDGRIQFLADCTHAMAGQTVDIPDWDCV
jgi:hypothetical protein